MSDFGSGSSIKVLEWLTLYKKLSSRDPSALSNHDAKTLKDLENKLGALLHKGSSPKPEPKRKNLRVQTNFEINLQSSGQLKKAYLKNISGGGLFVESNQQVTIGDSVQVRLTFSEKNIDMTLKGIVSWTNPQRRPGIPAGFGMKFIDLTDEARRIIHELVADSIASQLRINQENKK